MMLVTLTVSACMTAAPQGYANNRAGRALRVEMCRSVRDFVRGPLDEEGLRRTWLLPFGSYNDGSFDFYAPMSARPSDGVSHAFCERRVGQLTHYLLPPEFTAARVSCLTPDEGFTRTAWTQTEHEARGNVSDARAHRQVVIRAIDSTTSILVADEKWKGDIEAKLAWSREL